MIEISEAPADDLWGGLLDAPGDGKGERPGDGKGERPGDGKGERPGDGKGEKPEIEPRDEPWDELWDGKGREPGEEKGDTLWDGPWDDLWNKPGAEKKNDKRAAGRFADVAFYMVIACIIIVTLVFSGKTHDGFQLFGYSGFTVLSGSMEREIPEGSLVITKKVDAADIRVGDDITFIRYDNATVTHRVVDVVEDYGGSGARGFLTKGLENPEPDNGVVSAGNIIGVVKISVPGLGYTLSYITGNIGVVFAILGGILVVIIALSKACAAREEDVKFSAARTEEAA